MKKSLVAACLGLSAFTASAQVAGPDAFGYSSNHTNNPAAFTSIVGNGGTALLNTAGGSVDDASVTRPIGFNFSFYGQTFTQAFISTNGLLSFLGSNTAFTNNTLSATSGSIAAAPYWDDLYFTQGQQNNIYDLTRGAAGSREYVVEFSQVGFFNNSVGADTVTFQAIFRENGTFSFYYPDITSATGGNASSATVGIRDSGNTSATGRFLQYSFNTASLADGDVISYSGVLAVPEPATLIGGSLGLLAVGGAFLRRRRKA